MVLVGPSADGSAGQVLSTDGEGNIVFVDPQSGPQGIPGETGAQGLKGDKGDKGDQGEPGEQGPPGADGSDGVDGQDGASAYAIAVQNGFSGTESEWLDSLIGEQGPQGETGATGPNSVTASTATDLSGVVFADGTSISVKSIGTGSGDIAAGDAVPLHAAAANAHPISGVVSLRSELDSKRDGIVSCRNRYVNSWVEDIRMLGSTGNVTKGPALGDSLTQGSTSAGGYTAGYLYQLGALLASYTGVGTGTTWDPVNLGLGSSTLMNALPWIADYLAITTGSTNATKGTTLRSERGALWALYPAPYVTIMYGRNDLQISDADYELALRLLLRRIIAAKRDPILLIDPPAISSSTGEITDLATLGGARRQLMKAVAAQEGATFGDVYQRFVNLYDAGVDLRTLYWDQQSHLNAAGNAYVADVGLKCFIGECEPASRYNNRASVPHTFRSLNANYFSISGVTATSEIQGTVSQTLFARKTQMGESTNQAYICTDGQSGTFTPNGPSGGCVLSLSGPSSIYNGSATVTYGGVTVASGITQSLDLLREISTLIKFTGSFAGRHSSLVVTAVGGPIAITGVTFLGADEIWRTDKANSGTEVGTWSDEFLLSDPSTHAGRKSSTVGNTLTISWFGTDLTLVNNRSNSQGAFSASTDGTTSPESPFECYIASGSGVIVRRIAENLTLGWHTTVITILTKNASSSGNTVVFGQFKAFNRYSDRSSKIIPLVVGETVNLQEDWQTASISRVLQGTSPYILHNPGASTIQISGSSGDRAEVTLRR